MPGIARQGGFEVVAASGHNVRASTLNGFMCGNGPNRRFAGNIGPDRMDAVQVLPGGQRGIFLHPNYASQLPLWLTSSYHPMAFGERAVYLYIGTTRGPGQTGHHGRAAVFALAPGAGGGRGFTWHRRTVGLRITPAVA